MPTPEQLRRLYSDSWEDPVANRSNTGGTNARLASACAGKLVAELGRKDLSGLRVLDFGAGKGEMVRALREAGARACGVDPYGAQYLKDQGLEAYASLEDLAPGDRFDGILASDVIEHLSAPWVELRRFLELLVPGGWLYLSTPNPNGLRARLSGSRWIQAARPGHLIFFTPSTIQRMLLDCGFERPRRLRWFLGYGHSLHRQCGHFVLQAMALDGELRSLALKPG
jgi:2-polyprenyl-3-methyl-5-hydroxy-6-metoxy-1,4-benzoquinol methylase